MPTVREYIVTQERQTVVKAASPSDAITKAAAIFSGEDKTKPVIETGINAELSR